MRRRTKSEKDLGILSRSLEIFRRNFSCKFEKNCEKGLQTAKYDLGDHIVDHIKISGPLLVLDSSPDNYLGGLQVRE